MLELAAPSTKTLDRDDLDAMRRELWRRLGGLPARCELQIQQIERVDLGDIVREKLRYQVEPGEWVEGYVLRPSPITPGDRLPAVVALHAHGSCFEAGKMEIVDLYPEGYTRPSYAGWGVELARRGYVVICQDQICFEDRSWVARRGVELRGKDELLEGFQQIANGKTMVGKLAFDTSRAIDVLVARDDVDGNRIGVMGHSGGGIQSFNIMLFDPRASVAAINCGLGATAASIRDSRTSAFHGMIPGQDLLGDRAAVLATFAPRAVMLVNGSEDWLFPTDGVLNTYYRAKKAYRALGVEERLELTLFEGPHLFGDWVRDVGYQWIDRWLKQSPIDPEEIWYRGDRPDPASVRTHQIDIEGLRDCCGRYSKVQPDPAPVVRRTAALREPADMAIEEVRITVDHFNAVDNKRPELEPPNVASEYLANIRCLVDLPDFIDLWIGKGLPGADGRRPATLVLHRSIDPYEVGRDEVFAMAGDASYALAPPLCKEGHLVAAMDLFGHATRKNPINQRRWKDQPERTILFPAVRYIDAGTSLLERTVHEIRCVVSYLQGRDDVDADRVNLVGFGTGGFVALMAAVLEPAVQSVVAVGGVTTQQAAIEAELFDHYFLYQPGLVPAGDVGAALSLLAPRSCRMILFDNDSQWPRRGAEEVQQAMREAYAKAGCDEQLDLRTVAGKPRMDDQLTDQIVQWLR